LLCAHAFLWPKSWEHLLVFMERYLVSILFLYARVYWKKDLHKPSVICPSPIGLGSRVEASWESRHIIFYVSLIPALRWLHSSRIGKESLCIYLSKTGKLKLRLILHQNGLAMFKDHATLKKWEKKTNKRCLKDTFFNKRFIYLIR